MSEFTMLEIPIETPRDPARESDDIKFADVCSNVDAPRALASQAEGSGGSDGVDPDDDEGGPSGTTIVAKPESKTKTPAMYRVILMNDDYTPMDFVIHVLQKFFQKDMQDATRIMLEVHQKGAGTCGVFTFEIAETKVYQVNQYARQNRHPLKCIMERA